MYDSWMTRIMLYIRGKENGEMLRDSVEHGPYKFKSKITAKDTDGVIDIRRAKRLEDLKGDDKLRYDSDIKSVNILLLGFPVDIYTLINHYQTAKEIWDRVKELMKGTEMTKQEHESMLYDEFDKFTSEPGESIHSYYLIFDKLINDMNMIYMTMTPMQINTKFMNHLQPEWSRFVTAAKQARNLHKPLALLANTYNTPPSYSSNQTQYQAQPSKVYQPYQQYQSSTPITQQLIQSPPLQSYAPIIVPYPPTYQPDTGLAIPTFLPTDDPIASLNKAMITQATIHNSQVMVQNVQGRQSQGYASNAGNNQASGARVINAVGNTGVNQPRVIRCYNYKGKGHMAKQCTARKKDFLANSLEETNDCEDLKLQATSNFKAYHIDAYDSDFDDEAIENAIFMENLSPVGSLNDDTIAPHYDFDTLSKVPHYDTYHDSNVLNSNIQELRYIKNIISTNESYDELKGNNDVTSYTDYMLTIGDDADNYVPAPVQKNDMMLSVIKQIKSQVENCNKVNQESKSEIESLTSELGRYKDRVKVLGYAVKDGHSEQEAYLNRELYTVINDLFPKRLPSTSEVLKNLNKARDLLTKFDECMKRRTTLSPYEIGSWEQSDIKETKLYSVTPLPKSKIETELINAYFKDNRVVHRDYLKVAKEHVATLQELLEQARALKPLDEHIGYASKFAERIQELLVMKQTIETITKEHAVKQNTRKTDNTMLPSTGRVSSTYASGSKSKSNTKNDRIPQPSSRSMKNNVEAHHRKFKSSTNKNNHVSDCNANVKNVALSKNSNTICLSCNECLFSVNHDACVI
ncbi:hypothetical protein Tco_0175205 [Tanacetum coccineum]